MHAWASRARGESSPRICTTSTKRLPKATPTPCRATASPSGRELLREVGLLRECFRFYRNLDLDFSFQFRNLGYRILANGDLPLLRHEHRQWASLGEEERDQLSRRNFRHFFKRWGNRKDLLVSNTGMQPTTN